jgi:bacterioferritin
MQVENTWELYLDMSFRLLGSAGMQVDPSSNASLNAVLTKELTAINQLFLHARMCQHWGLSELNEPIYKASIAAMKYADRITQRILFLEGLPNYQDLGRLMIGEDVAEVLANDVALSKQRCEVIVAAIAQCESTQDYQSREHLDHLLKGVEAFLDWGETQLSLIDDVGLENYIQSQLEEEGHSR